ncbi:MAG TPA: hypothetical protein ENI73_07770 [Spirochaetes bacterium]|nr:hypothetical protein [Spirochaetota bacterium]
MKYLTLLALILFSLNVPRTLLAGKLDRARGNIKQGGKSRSSSSSRRHSNRSSSDGNDPLGELLGYILISPFWITHHGLKDSFSHETYFYGAPYKHDKKGYLLIDRNPGSDNERDDKRIISHNFQHNKSFNIKELDKVSLSLFAEDSYDINDRINRFSWGGMMDTSFRLGLETTWTHFYEKLNTGSDSFIIFDVNVVFRFAQNEYAQFYVGIGGRGLLDKAGDSGGVHGTYFFNIYPTNPFQ